VANESFDVDRGDDYEFLGKVAGARDAAQQEEDRVRGVLGPSPAASQFATEDSQPAAHPRFEETVLVEPTAAVVLTVCAGCGPHCMPRLLLALSDQSEEQSCDACSHRRVLGAVYQQRVNPRRVTAAG